MMHNVSTPGEESPKYYELHRTPSNASLHKIETNYRSSPEILAFANAILKAQPAGLNFSKN